MSQKLVKQKQLLHNLLSQVQYLQENGIKNMKLICYPCDEFEKILQECSQVFGSEEMPSKDLLVKSKNNLEETRDMMMHEFVVSILGDKLEINSDYFELSRDDIFRQKANAKIGQTLDKKKRGFCD